MRRLLSVGAILLILIISLTGIAGEFRKMGNIITKLENDVKHMSNINDTLRGELRGTVEDYDEMKVMYEDTNEKLEKATSELTELKNTNQSLRNKNESLEKKLKVKTPTRSKGVGESKVTNNIKKSTTTKATTGGKSLGTFQSTAYCNCSICCGKWTGGKTASGTTPTAGRTIAVDTNVIPMGTKVYIEGVGVRIAEDSGSAVKGKIIDLHMSDHQSALSWGRRNVEVKIK